MKLHVYGPWISAGCSGDLVGDGLQEVVLGKWTLTHKRTKWDPFLTPCSKRSTGPQTEA